MEVSHTLDMILTVVVLSFWVLFPIGMFLSVSHVDKNTDQVIRLDQLRHDSTPEFSPRVAKETRVKHRRPQNFNRPQPLPH